jgi:hypothetical protein
VALCYESAMRNGVVPAGSRRPRRELGRSLLAALLIPLLGCTQVTRINTTPVGAKVFLNGNLIGVSPARYAFENGPGDTFPSRFHARFERAGYEPLEVDLPTRISAGRVAAGIFTLGLAFALQGVRVVDPSYTYSLYPIGTNEAAISEDWVRDLRKLDRLRQDGLLTETEYQRRRSILLRDTPQGAGELNTH